MCRVSRGCCPEENVIVTQQRSRGIVHVHCKRVNSRSKRWVWSSILTWRRRGDSKDAWLLYEEVVFYIWHSRQRKLVISGSIKHGHAIVIVISYIHVNIHKQPWPIKGSPFTIYMQGVTDTTEIQTSGLQTPSLYLVGQAVQHLVTATSMCVSTWGNISMKLV